jgi:hypothetical protein
MSAFYYAPWANQQYTPAMNQNLFRIAAASFAFVLAALSVRADSVSYIASDAGAFGTLNLSTGAFQQIGSGRRDPGPGLTALNGSLYTLGFDGVLNSVNTGTGIETPIGPALGDCSIPGVSGCGSTSALAFGALNGTFYATDFANNLYTLNPSTGKATLVGSTGMAKVTFVPGLPAPNGTFTGVDESLFAAGGKLYANEDFVTIDPTSPNPVVGVPLADALYQINTATGQATLIAPTLTPLNSFVNVNGTEYAFDGNVGEVVTVNLANGSTSMISNYDPAAGIIVGASPVPEPISLALCFAGLAVVAVVARRRRSAT